MTNKKQWSLICACWLSCVFTQLGRYTYTSNITLIMDRFAVNHTDASLPATLFFFAYGIGQIFVGIFCHKFNRRLLVMSALILSGLINLVIFLGAEFIAIKYLWLLNGLAQANIWPLLLLIIRENVSPIKIGVASILMATASTGGKFVAIGVCAIFAIDTSAFMYCFLTAAVLLFFCATVFFFSTLEIKKPEKTSIDYGVPKSSRQKPDKKGVILLLLLGEFSLAAYAIEGGLQSWIPVILKENYNLSDALSIFMSIFLPLFTLSAAVITPLLYKKLKNYVLISLLSFVGGAVLITGVLLLLNTHWIPIIILFTVEAIAMGIVSNTTTVQVPLTFNGKFDAGFLAGYLNGACYIGMAVATYALGYVADASGWTGALILLICVAIFSAFLALIYLILRIKGKRSNKFENNLDNRQTAENE
nr:MFS transporter [Clostridia bacterium]